MSPIDGASIVYFVLLTLFVVVLLPTIRRHWRENVIYEQNVHALIIIRQSLIFLFPLMLTILALGISFATQQLLSLIVLGVSISVFWITQLPLLTQAQLAIDFAVDQTDKFSKIVILESKSEHVQYTRIYNLGFSTLKDAKVIIYFENGIIIVPCPNEKYNELDFVKKFSTQKCNCAAMFAPKENFLTLPPQEWLIFPIIVQSPEKELVSRITIHFSSENSWGERIFTTTLKIN
jgi:hypothetical protein